MEPSERANLLRIIGTLMYSENGGDVHEVINQLCDLAGIQHPEGNFLDGWTDADHERVGISD